MNPSTTQNFVRIAQGIARRPAGIALPLRFQVCICDDW